jgi:hypothetical protein
LFHRSVGKILLAVLAGLAAIVGAVLVVSQLAG